MIFNSLAPLRVMDVVETVDVFLLGDILAPLIVRVGEGRDWAGTLVDVPGDPRRKERWRWKVQ